MDGNTHNLENENFIYGNSPVTTRINIKHENSINDRIERRSFLKEGLILCNDFFSNIKRSLISLTINRLCGTGFFIEIPIPSKKKPMRGIMTNNHVLNEDSFISNLSIYIYMENTTNSLSKIKKKDINFIFTSELIDVTFIELNQETINKIKPCFLCPNNNDANLHDSILIFQFYYLDRNSKSIKFANGTIRELHGFDYYHGISTERGSSGSPLLDKNFKVVGVHKSGKEDHENSNNNVNIATKYSEIEFAIRMFYEMPKRIECAKLSARPLEDNEIEELQKKGLHSKFSVKDIKDVESEIERIVEEENEIKEKKKEFRLILKSLFYCDCSKELLFYKTNYAWYFAKSINDINYFLLNCLKSLEWFPIIPNDDEEMNINIPLVLNNKELNLIYWLKSTNFKYL